MWIKNITEEQQLDELYRTKQVNNKILREKLLVIAGLRGELRYIHLQTHLSPRSILSVAQTKQYDNLRGYGKSGGHHHEHHH